MTTAKLKRGRPIKGDSPLVTRMAFRISDDMRQEVEEICEHDGITMSQFITKALDSYIGKIRQKGER